MADIIGLKYFCLTIHKEIFRHFYKEILLRNTKRKCECRVKVAITK